MIGTIKQYPEIARGWWWEFRYNSMRYSGYAHTKNGATRAMKRRHKKVVKQGTGQTIEVDLG
jgi:hypothetical protein